MSMTVNHRIDRLGQRTHLVVLTDTQGRELLPDGYLDQPHPGSVVLTNGEFGTAWQRSFKDGLWRCTQRDGAKTWEWLLSKRNLVLVYDARERFNRIDMERES